MSKTIPLRYDIVGSFLRPEELKKARLSFNNGQITKQQLKEVEDRLIIELIEKQQNNGLEAVTDGEFRRRWWHLDFIQELKGITKYSVGNIRTFQNVEMENAESYFVSGKIAFDPNHSFIEDFRFLLNHAGGAVAKQTIPGPNLIYLIGALLHPRYHENPVYETITQLEDDIVVAYQAAIEAFYQAGCRYLQLDDTAWGKLLEKQPTDIIEGYTVAEILKRCADITRRAIANKPADMAVTIHFCRGNFKSSWLYEGGYETIAKDLLSIEGFDGFFLEYDTERAGSFEPLRHLKGQKIVLGLITTKTAELEQESALLKRIKEAEAYVPLSQICISPQCGFASTEDGNALTEEEQWAKIRLLVQLGKKLESLSV